MVFDAILLSGSMIVFLVMLYAMGKPAGEGWFLSPLLLAAAGLLLLWPLREERVGRTLLLTGGVLLLVWLLKVLGGVLFPFILVFILATLFNPLVAQLQERFRIPRWVSSIVVTALALGFILLVVLQVVPNLVAQAETLAVRGFESVDGIQGWLASTSMLDAFEESGLLDRQQVAAEIGASVQNLADSLTTNLPNVARNLFGYFSSLLNLFLIIGVVPVLLYYMLKDYPFITRRLVELFPTFGGRRDYLVQASEVVGNYMRGQLIISAIAAFNVTVLLLLFNVPFALLIGLLTGILNLIPNIGALITAVIAVLITLVFGGPWQWLVVLGVLLGQNVLEQSFLSPKILSREVGLHPILILLSLFVFGYFLGLLGLLIAVPITAMLMTSYKAYRHELSFELSSDAQLKRDLARRLFDRFRTEPAPEDSSA